MTLRSGRVAALVVVALAAAAVALATVPQARATATAGTPAQRVGWESYWYSLYNLSSLSMGKSGMGIRFTAPKAKLMAVLKAAGLKKPPLQNPYFVSVPYAGGDPHLVRSFHETDGASWRWDPKSFDRTVTPQSYAWTATKYSEWAKNFENHSTASMDHFRGLMLNNLAATAAGWMETHLKLPNGLFAASWKNGHIANRHPRLSDQWAVLESLASLETVADPKNGFDWYKAPLPAAKVRAMEDSLFMSVAKSELLRSQTQLDRARGVEALAWYARTTEDATQRDRAVRLALDEAAKLRQGKASTLDALAVRVRGEGQAVLLAKALGEKQAATAARSDARAAWQTLDRRYWLAKPGLYAPNRHAKRIAYTPELMADLTGALNVAVNVLHDGKAGKRYDALFINAVDRGHLIAAQGKETAGFKNGLPSPPKANGRFGVAPVFVSRIVYDRKSGSWRTADWRFRTATAMRLADEMFWMGQWAGQDVKGPPALGLPYLTG